MFVVTISFTPVDDLQTTGKNSVRLLLYRSYYVSSLECFDVIVCLRYNECFEGSVCFGGGTFAAHAALGIKSIPSKTNNTLISFNIVDFHPSITETLLNKAITWARRYTEINDKDIRTIKHARKSLLFHNNRKWTKRDSDSTFDVTMGSYDGAEVCELVGLFMLHSLQGRFGKNIGLYRDDGLALIQTKSGRLSDKGRKDLIQTFNDFGLKITAQANEQLINFLHLTLNLTDGTYKPYRKPNDKSLYINRSSNHPPSIIRQLPLSINRRIYTLSCDKQAFDSTAVHFITML